MWPMGHVAVAYLCYTASTRLRFEDSPGYLLPVIVGFGALVPDLVDKPLAWYLGVLPTGRSLMHSFLVLVPLVLAVYLAARWRGAEEYGVAFGIGVISHPVLDVVPVLWNGDAGWTFLFWPALSVSPYEGSAPTVLGLLRDSITDPYFISEFVFLALALYVWRADGYPGLELLVGRFEAA